MKRTGSGVRVKLDMGEEDFEARKWGGIPRGRGDLSNTLQECGPTENQNQKKKRGALPGNVHTSGPFRGDSSLLGGRTSTNVEITGGGF